MVLPRLKEIREKMNKTQAQLSDYLSNEKGLNISRGTIAKYESGVNYPSPQTMNKLAHALNVSEYYLSGKGTQRSDIDHKLISLLHNKYFNISDSTDEFHQYLKNYLLFLGDYNTPLSFYRNKDGDIDETAKKTHFPQFDEINEFWKKDFSFLFKNPNFIDSLVGTTNKEFENLVLNKLKDQYSKDVDNRNFNILIDEVDNMAHNIELTASKVINHQATKKELLSAIDQGIQNLQFAKENFFLSEDSTDEKNDKQ